MTQQLTDGLHDNILTDTPTPATKRSIKNICRAIVEDTSIREGKTVISAINTSIKTFESSENHAIFMLSMDEQLASCSGKPMTMKEIKETLSASGYPKAALNILLISYLKRSRDFISLYIDERYRDKLDTLFVDTFLKDDSVVAIQYVPNSNQDYVSELNLHCTAQDNSDLSIARAIIAKMLHYPQIAQRTKQVSSQAVRLGKTLRRANDPHKLLNTDIPDIFPENAAKHVNKAFDELDTFIGEVKDKAIIAVTRAIGCDLLTINSRAKAMIGKTGNPELDLFIKRLSELTNRWDSVEGLLVVLNNNTAIETDLDLTHALTQLSIRLEQFAVNEAACQSDINSISIVTNINGEIKTVVKYFSDSDKLNEFIKGISDES